MSHLHHLTYEHKYNEPLEDLQGLCEACHEFVHGKRNRDPLLDVTPMFGRRKIQSVYLAGRISHGNGNWRSSIVPGWEVGSGVTWWKWEGPGEKRRGKRATGSCNGGYPDSMNGDEERVAILPDGREIRYSGPFWIDVNGGHGGGDGPHAMGEDFTEGHKCVVGPEYKPDGARLSDPHCLCTR